MNYAQALVALRTGSKLVRSGWANNKVYVIQTPIASSLSSVELTRLNNILHQFKLSCLSVEKFYLISNKNMSQEYVPSSKDTASTDWRTLESWKIS